MSKAKERLDKFTEGREMRADEKGDLATLANDIVVTQLARIKKRSDLHKLNQPESRALLDLVRAGMILAGKIEVREEDEPQITQKILEEALDKIKNKDGTE